MDSSTAVRGARSWPALTAWGAGLIQLALGAGALTGAQGGAVPITAGIALAGLGAAGFAWGGTALARGRLVVPRAGVVGVLTGLVALAAALGTDPEHVSVAAVAAASALLIATGIGCALTLRRAGRPGSRMRVLGLVVSAVVVAALVTPALAASEAARLAGDGVSLTVLEHHH